MSVFDRRVQVKPLRSQRVRTQSVSCHGPIRTSRTVALAGGVTAQRNYFDVIFTDAERHVVVLKGAGRFTVLIRELMTYKGTMGGAYGGASSGAKVCA